ncbi:MAG TPA: hypothetical protein PK718_01840 [Candidatus Methanofastidiosa archaeon]|nr:hypothetical protein [Candidatus Methanofastidiosa archaeon]HPR41272.1 hypothetical protein [Candidatus Methanofastidiosa archaeon]
MSVPYKKNFRKPDIKKKSKRKPCLSMRNMDDFKFKLAQILKEIDEKNYAQVSGMIYAKASRQDIKEAKNYISDKEKEGVIPEETAKKLNRLLSRYSTYR